MEPIANMSRLERLRDGKWAFAALLVLTLGFGLFARTLRAGEGLPYLHRWGEPNIAGRSLQMLKTGDLNPHWFNYGSPTLYACAAVDVVHYMRLAGLPAEHPESLTSPDDIETQFPQKFQWTISHPSFYFWNRMAMALFGAGSVLLTFLIGLRLGGRWEALLAAAVVAGVAIHVEVSATIRSDGPAAFLTLAAVLASLEFRQRARPGALCLAFVLAGLAASTKYNVVFALGAPALALLLAWLERRPEHRGWLWLCLLSLPPVAFVCGTPFALFDLSTFLKDVGSEVYHYKVTGQGARTAVPGLAHVWDQCRELAANVGIVPLLFAPSGLVWLLRRRGHWIVFVFPLVYLAFMARTTVNHPHNLATAYPFVALAMAAGVAGGVRLLGARRALPLVAIAALLAGWHMSSALLSSARVGLAQESRSRAMQQLEDLRAGRGWMRIGVASELRVHSIDLARLGVEPEIAKIADLVQRRADFDAIVLPDALMIRDSDGEGVRKRAGALSQLLPEEGIVLRIEGEPLFLTVRSVNPGVRVVATGGGGS